MSITPCRLTSPEGISSKARDRKKAQILVALRNLGLLPAIEEGKIVISSIKKSVHVWNLQGLFFNRLLQSSFRETVELRQGKLNIQGLDRDSLSWLIDFMEGSDKKRLDLLATMDVEKLLPLCLSTDYFQIGWLTEKLELMLIEHLSADSNLTIELHAFKHLKRCVFLRKWFVAIEGLPLALAAQKARGLIFSRLKQIPALKLEASSVNFLLSIPAREAPVMEFLVEGKLPDIDSLEQIARNFKSKKLLLHVLKVRLNSLGLDLELPSPKKLYVDGLHVDNYRPHLRPEPNSARYLKQKQYFQLSCPAAAYDALLTCSRLDEEVCKLIKAFPELKLGIKLSNEALLNATIPEMPNVRLLAFEPAPSQEQGEKLSPLIARLPHLEILVVHPQSKGLLEKALVGRKICLWKSLQGIFKKRVAIRNSFDVEWEKQPDILK